MARGGAANASYAVNGTPSRPQQQMSYRIGIYGWRKRCLYLFILLLMVLIVINLALTIWILKVLNFNIDGMGKLRILDKGLRLEGESEFLKPLYAAEVRSRLDQPLVLESARNVTMNARNLDGQVTGRLVVGANDVVAMNDQFEVDDNDGKMLFYADTNEVVVGADRLRVTGEQGAVFAGSVQTPHVRAEPFEPLKLESTTRSLYVQAPEGVTMEAEGGGFTTTSRTDIKLTSSQGKIVLDAGNIHLQNIPESAPSRSGRQLDNVFELCTCPDGKLFLAVPASGCEVNAGICS
ncbi:zeta-sarcoglycan-like [Branchiostoma floridae]|uniref:Zeta-sarcoglycan-like n=1 Tax=Branchiostoma floridae TaxID=7739 RepID=A0A9J7LGS7_BRAFL|nr:zeta-sarcoglycan-like [Branchiostoma floridae]